MFRRRRRQILYVSSVLLASFLFEAQQPAQAVCTPPLGPGSADSCNIRAACGPTLAETRALVKIRSEVSGQTFAGSGVLINTGLPGAQGAPLVLTASHLLDLDGDGDLTDPEAQAFSVNSQFFFGLESDCDGQNVATPYQTNGSVVVAADEPADMVLLQLQNTSAADLAANADPYYAGWDLTADPLSAGDVHVLHHPCCDVKMISGGVPEDNFGVFIRLTSLSCGGLQSGSSGAPIFDTDTGNVLGVYSGIQVPKDVQSDICAGQVADILFTQFNAFGQQWLGAQDSVPGFDPA